MNTAVLEGLEVHPVTLVATINPDLPRALVLPGVKPHDCADLLSLLIRAFKASDLPYPKGRIEIDSTIPAHLCNSASWRDLALSLAVAILEAQDSPISPHAGLIQSPAPGRALIVGTLAADGRILPIRGAVPFAMLAANPASPRHLILPAWNAQEASAVPSSVVLPAETLAQVVAHLQGRSRIEPTPHLPLRPAPEHAFKMSDLPDPPFGPVKSYIAAALAASGQVPRAILLVDTPATGPTLIARRVASLLPQPSPADLLRIAQIYSAAGITLAASGQLARPFRAPHHSISTAGLLGGGTTPRPGEITLSHHGILYLEDLAWFRRDTLADLRAVLAEGSVTIGRAASQVSFPARPAVLIASVSPQDLRARPELAEGFDTIIHL